MKYLLSILTACIFVGAAEGVSAVEVTENLEVGAALRARVDYDPDRDIKKLGVDTFRPYIKYDSDSWIGAARYRFYGKAYPYQYTDKLADISFPEYAWVGYRFDKQNEVQVGLNQVPFGILPYFSSTITETLGYVLGLEDLYQLGAKYKTVAGEWSLQGGYYIRPAFQGKGTSKDGVTYSNVPSHADSYVEHGSNNHESQLIALRVTRAANIFGWNTDYGVSALTSQLHNADTNKDGRRNAAAVHVTSNKGPWTTGFLLARQKISARNPGSDDLITYGGYDSSYNIASNGSLVVADLNYDLSGSYLFGLVTGVRLYGNYSAFIKSNDGYRNTQRYIVGTGFSVAKDFYIGTEWLFGKNDPYVGGSSYTQSLAAGGTDHWENQLTMSIGYYF